MMTGYRFTKRINECLEAENLKAIPPQMVYQYLSKGWIPFADVDGQRLVDEEAAEEWLDKYLEKRLAKAQA